MIHDKRNTHPLTWIKLSWHRTEHLDIADSWRTRGQNVGRPLRMCADWTAGSHHTLKTCFKVLEVEYYGYRTNFKGLAHTNRYKKCIIFKECKYFWLTSLYFGSIDLFHWTWQLGDISRSSVQVTLWFIRPYHTMVKSLTFIMVSNS